VAETKYVGEIVYHQRQYWIQALESSSHRSANESPSPSTTTHILSSSGPKWFE